MGRRVELTHCGRVVELVGFNREDDARKHLEDEGYSPNHVVSVGTLSMELFYRLESEFHRTPGSWASLRFDREGVWWVATWDG